MEENLEGDSGFFLYVFTESRDIVLTKQLIGDMVNYTSNEPYN
jgi:hypothetical protein